MRPVTILICLSLVSSVAKSASAKDELHNRDLLIKKLTYIHEHGNSSGPAQVSLTLRLADLLAERARMDALMDLDSGCTECTAGKVDRERALTLYLKAVDQAPGDLRERVKVQIGHLYQLIGDQKKALDFYQQILASSKESDLAHAEANMAVAEILFQQNKFLRAIPYYEKVISHPKVSSRGLAAYRKSWCNFHLGEINYAVKGLETILADQTLLVRPGSETNNDDASIREEVVRDLVVFLAKKKFGISDLDLVLRHSSEKTRVQNAMSLALEAERVGLRAEALMVWKKIINKIKVAEDRLQASLSLAYLTADLGDNSQSLKEFKATIDYWRELDGCGKPSCEELRKRVRNYITQWSKRDNNNQSKDLLNASEIYLKAFPQDMEVQLLAANISFNIRNYALAWEYFGRIQKGNASKEVLETALTARIEIAEISKDGAWRSESYRDYLSKSPTQKNSSQVRYQLIRLDYENANYGEAALKLYGFAKDVKETSGLRLAAAHLALDSLVLLKNRDADIVTWAAQFEKLFPSSTGKEFGEIRQKAILTVAATLAENQPELAFTKLHEFDEKTASPGDRATYYRNQILIAEKLQKYTEAIIACDGLIASTKSEEDKQFALEKKTKIAELILEFSTALQAFEQLKKGSISAAERSLRLAILAELSDMNPSPYYKQYLATTKDQEGKKLAAAKIFEREGKSIKVLEGNKAIFADDPEQLVKLYLEAYNAKKNTDILNTINRTKALASTSGGKLVARKIFFDEFTLALGRSTSSQLNHKSQKKLISSIKAWADNLSKLERVATQALKIGEWSSQLIAIEAIARENLRFYQELISAPLPQGLSDNEQQQYLSTLGQQAAPYLARSEEAKKKLGEFWGDTKWREKISGEFQDANGIAVIGEELKYLVTIAPSGAKPALEAKVLTDEMKTSKPSPEAITAARIAVKQNPNDKIALLNLLDLERQAENTPMVGYLEMRLSDGNKNSGDKK